MPGGARKSPGPSAFLRMAWRYPSQLVSPSIVGSKCAGHGEMTEHLVRSGAPVYAVELDPSLVERLRRLAQKHPNLTIVPGDVLETNLRALAAGRRIRLYGNLPYYITSPILHQLFKFADLLDEIHIVIQLEVAVRLTARPGKKDYGYLSVAAQFFTRPEFVFK